MREPTAQIDVSPLSHHFNHIRFHRLGDGDPDGGVQNTSERYAVRQQGVQQEVQQGVRLGVRQEVRRYGVGQVLHRAWPLLVLAFLTGSCATPMTQRWTNFKAYYNTYYNAKTFYEAGLAKGKTIPDAKGTANIRIYPSPGKAGMEDFRKAIDKGANVLRDHEESDFVDQALFLIGKSYFQRGEYFSAIQKFEELLQVAQEAELQESAVFWLSRTMFEMELHQDAIERTLQEISLRPQWDARRLAQVELILAEHHIRLEQLDEAIELLDRGLPLIEDRDVRIRGNFLLAQLFENRGEFEQAVDAYERVVRSKGEYSMIYQALRNQAIAYRELGEYRRSEQILRKMIKDDKNISSVDELSLEQALTIQASGDVERALDMHHAFLDRPVRSQDRVSTARTYYAIAEIAHFDKQNFSLAAIYYDSAAGLRIPADQLPSGFEAEERATSFGEYATLEGQIAEMDSLLRLGRMNDQERDSVLETIRERRRVELAEQLKAQRQQQNTVTVVDAQAVQQGGSDQYGFLNHLNQAMLDNARSQFKALWGDRPLVDQWRRREAVLAMSRQQEVATSGPGASDQGEVGMPVLAQSDETAEGVPVSSVTAGSDVQTLGVADGSGTEIAASIASSFAGAGSGLSAASASSVAAASGVGHRDSEAPRQIRRLSGTAEDAQLQLDVSRIPVDSLTQREMEDQLQLKTLQMANVVYLSMGMSGYAEPIYERVVQVGTDSTLKAQALYILARISEAAGEQTRADSLARRVVDEYAGTLYAERIAFQYGWSGVGDDSLSSGETQVFNGFHRDSLRVVLEYGVTGDEGASDVEAMLEVAEALREWVRNEVSTQEEVRNSLLLYESAKRYVAAARITTSGQEEEGTAYRGALWDSARVILGEIEKQYARHPVAKPSGILQREIALKEEPATDPEDASNGAESAGEGSTGTAPVGGSAEEDDAPRGAASGGRGTGPSSDATPPGTSPSTSPGTPPGPASPSPSDSSTARRSVPLPGGRSPF